MHQGIVTRRHRALLATREPILAADSLWANNQVVVHCRHIRCGPDGALWLLAPAPGIYLVLECHYTAGNVNADPIGIDLRVTSKRLLGSHGRRHVWCRRCARAKLEYALRQRWSNIQRMS